MKKMFFLFIICFFISAYIFSQKKSAFYLNGGVALFVPWSYHSDAAFFPAFTLTPGLNILQEKDYAVVLSVPISAGITYKSDAFAGIDLPVMLSLNFGSASGNNEHAKFGIIAGAGAAYINVVNHYDDALQKKIHTEFWGYRFNAGISFKKDSGVIPSVIFSFGKSITKNNGSVVGIGLQLIITDQ